MDVDAAFAAFCIDALLHRKVNHAMTTLLHTNDQQADAHPRNFHLDILNHVSDGVYFVDTQSRICFWNKAAARITGYDGRAVLGRACSDNLLRHVNDTGKCLCTEGCPLAKTLQDGVAREGNVYLHHRDGYRIPVHISIIPMHDENGVITGAIETFRDNTVMMRNLEQIQDLRKAAFIDALTGLANRRYMEEAIEKHLSELHSTGRDFGMIMLDVDHFKQFNDQFGHSIGDHVLRMVGQTLSHNCRAYDTVGRWGGEEFMVIAEQIDARSLKMVTERLRTLVESSWLLENNRRLGVTASFGATIAHADETSEMLIQRVDKLLYASKMAGRNHVTSDDQNGDSARML